MPDESIWDKREDPTPRPQEGRASKAGIPELPEVKPEAWAPPAGSRRASPEEPGSFGDFVGTEPA